MHVWRMYDTPHGSMCVRRSRTRARKRASPPRETRMPRETIRVIVEIAQIARKSTMIDGGYVRSSREIRERDANACISTRYMIKAIYRCVS